MISLNRKPPGLASSSRHGIAAVECAFVAPLLTLLVLGAIDVGQYANIYQKVSDASREGARAAVRTQTLTTSQVNTDVMNYLHRCCRMSRRPSWLRQLVSA
jgi:Flp pilus assembly protein TadG